MWPISINRTRGFFTVNEDWILKIYIHPFSKICVDHNNNNNNNNNKFAFKTFFLIRSLTRSDASFFSATFQSLQTYLIQKGFRLVQKKKSANVSLIRPPYQCCLDAVECTVPKSRWRIRKWPIFWKGRLSWGGGEGGETEINVSSPQIYLVLLGFSFFFFLSFAKVEFLLTFR